MPLLWGRGHKNVIIVILNNASIDKVDDRQLENQLMSREQKAYQ